MVYALFVLLLAVAHAQTLSCTGRNQGFYCVDASKYAWCYGAATPSIVSCAPALSCQCGFTTASPCTWPGSKPSPCSGNVGDITGALPPPAASSSSSDVPDLGDQTEPPEVPGPSSPVVGTYFTNWSQYRYGDVGGYTCQFLPRDIDASRLTHLLYGFAVFDETYQVKNYEWNDFDFYKEIVAKKKTYPHLKTLISIGGWNFNFFESTKHLFTTMAASAKHRATFIKSLIDYAYTHGFDGVDLDWEYPGFADQGGRPVDTVNFTTLLRELRNAINKETRSPKLLLAIAAPCGEEKIKLLQLDKIHKYLDFIDLMGYDYHGSWDNTAGPHTALHGAYSELNSAHAIDLYLAAGVPANKLILGLAAYGRTWMLKTTGTGASGYGTPTNGAGTAGKCTGEKGFLSTFEIDNFIKQGATAKEDKATDTWYAYSNDMFVTYDSVENHATKIDYACSKGLGGAFIWAMDLDTKYKMINAMNTRVNSKCSPSPIPPTTPSSSAPTPPTPPTTPSSSAPTPPTPPTVDCSTECFNKFQTCVATTSQTTQICTCVAAWVECLKGNNCASLLCK